MKKQLRADKYLADMGIGTRTEVKQSIKNGMVKVNGETIKKPDFKINPTEDEVFYNLKKIEYVTWEYYMLNKPAGVVSATEDNRYETVVELIHDSSRKDLFPVGRLDIDTEGLLIITNDGALAHKLLSPKRHVSKVYYAEIDGNITEEAAIRFKEGIQIDSEFRALPAELEIKKQGDISEVCLTIYEGKFHQVKRMFEAVGREVLYLKRISMGELSLDPSLDIGDYRKLTEEEIQTLKNS